MSTKTDTKTNIDIDIDFDTFNIFDDLPHTSYYTGNEPIDFFEKDKLYLEMIEWYWGFLPDSPKYAVYVQTKFIELYKKRTREIANSSDTIIRTFNEKYKIDKNMRIVVLKKIKPITVTFTPLTDIILNSIRYKIGRAHV